MKQYAVIDTYGLDENFFASEKMNIGIIHDLNDFKNHDEFVRFFHNQVSTKMYPTLFEVEIVGETNQDNCFGKICIYTNKVKLIKKVEEREVVANILDEYYEYDEPKHQGWDNETYFQSRTYWHINVFDDNQNNIFGINSNGFCHLNLFDENNNQIKHVSIFDYYLLKKANHLTYKEIKKCIPFLFRKYENV
jgi:hypothetical protein